MNLLIRVKTKTSPILLLLTLISVVLVPTMHAVVPAPDGGYPGGNTAEGQGALLSLTIGTFNTAIGWYSLRSDMTGQFNTAVGAGTLFANTANENTATGAGALLSNSTGGASTANGAFALFSNTEGSYNTAVGDRALFGNTVGNDNTAIGVSALALNTQGNTNTAIGRSALFLNTGSNNTAIGAEALQNNTSGAGNTAVGHRALRNNTNGFGNIALGFTAGLNVTTANNVIAIGIPAANVSNTCFIGNTFGVQTQNGNALPVVIDSAGQLGTASSSAKFKKEIKPMDNASEAILALKPVTFYYESDKTGTPQFGLIAEDVAAVNRDLVARDANGEVYTVRYEAVNAMLLNEFLKEHRQNEEQQITIARQQKQIEALTAGLQRVSAQLELIKAASRTALNDP